MISDKSGAAGGERRLLKIRVTTPKTRSMAKP
jgi:hypothetical protein